MRLSPQGVTQGWVAVCKLGWLLFVWTSDSGAVGGRGRWCPVMGGLGFLGGGVSVSRRQSKVSGCLLGIAGYRRTRQKLDLQVQCWIKRETGVGRRERMKDEVCVMQPAAEHDLSINVCKVGFFA